MTTRQSDPSGPSRPSPPRRPSSADRGYPRLRAAIWVAAVLCGGLLIVLVFFSTIGVVNFYQAPAIGIAALLMAAFFVGTMWSYSRSEARGNSRWSDRERRGF